MHYIRVRHAICETDFRAQMSVIRIHTKSGPPLANHGSLQALRENVETLNSMRASWHRLGDEVQGVLDQFSDIHRYFCNFVLMSLFYRRPFAAADSLSVKPPFSGIFPVNSILFLDSRLDPTFP